MYDIKISRRTLEAFWGSWDYNQHKINKTKYGIEYHFNFVGGGANWARESWDNSHQKWKGANVTGVLPRKWGKGSLGNCRLKYNCFTAVQKLCSYCVVQLKRIGQSAHSNYTIPVFWFISVQLLYSLWEELHDDTSLGTLEYEVNPPRPSRLTVNLGQDIICYYWGH